MSALEDILNLGKIKEPWFTKKGLLPHGVGIMIISLALAGGTALSLNGLGFPYSLHVFSAIAFIPLVGYLVLFYIRRSWWSVLASNKLNVVVAYNLEGLDDRDKFYKKYDKFLKQLKNEVSIQNLGRHIRIIPREVDTVFSDKAAAEEKTKLALTGATLLVWGHVTRRKRKTRFKTSFSYEFVYPKTLKEEVAQKAFGRTIDKGLEGGLFGLDKYRVDVDGDVFGENILPTVLFILGCSSASIHNFEKTQMLFGKFKEEFGRASLMRRKAMLPALVQINSILEKMYEDYSWKAMEQGRYEDAKEFCLKLLEINNRNYAGNLRLAVYYEHLGDRRSARMYNEAAAKERPRSYHDDIFNEAYFALDEGDYDKALKLYADIPAETVSYVGVEQYFHKKYQETRNVVFLFGEGVVAFKFEGNVEHARSILESFVKEANVEEDRYRVLIAAAQEVLDEKSTGG